MLNFQKMLLFVAFGTTVLHAATKSKPRDSQLQPQVYMQINGLTRPVKDGDLIAVFPGDRMRLIADRARLSFLSVNVVGLHGASDLNREFLPRDLDSHYALASDSKRYKGEIKVKGKVVSKFTIAVVNPELQGVEVSINSKSRVMRENEIMVLRRADLFKVITLKTNIPENKGVEYEVVKGSGKGEASHTLKFSLAGEVFGEVPIKVIE